MRLSNTPSWLTRHFHGCVPVAGDPVDHVAAVAGAERAGLVAVEEGVLLLRRGPALLQVFQRAVAPVLADRVGERLAVAGRAVEVDHHHRVALAGIGLRIPAVAPAVAEAALRAAVDQERDRILLAFLVVPRLDHVAVHGVAVPALELELLVVAERTSGSISPALGVIARSGAPSMPPVNSWSPLFSVLRVNASVGPAMSNADDRCRRRRPR